MVFSKFIPSPNIPKNHIAGELRQGAESAPCCKHRGKPVEPAVKVNCHTCGNQRHVLYRPYECAIYKRCLPEFKPTGQTLKEWQGRKPESELYHLCGEHCDSYSPSDQIQPLTIATSTSSKIITDIRQP